MGGITPFGKPFGESGGEDVQVSAFGRPGLHYYHWVKKVNPFYWGIKIPLSIWPLREVWEINKVVKGVGKIEI